MAKQHAFLVRANARHEKIYELMSADPTRAWRASDLLLKTHRIANLSQVNISLTKLFKDGRIEQATRGNGLSFVHTTWRAVVTHQRETG